MSKINKVFPKPLEAKYINNGIWELTKPYRYKNKKIQVDIPEGFKSDGASIPKIFWSIIGSPWTGKYARAALIHDFCYWKQIFTRKISDVIFLDAMEVLRVSLWRRRIMYYSVRFCAWIIWNKHSRELKKKNTNLFSSRLPNYP
jgi:hypothetical protein